MHAAAFLTESCSEDEPDFPPQMTLSEALQILQLDASASRDLMKEQYLKVATPVHPQSSHSQDDPKYKKFRKLTLALFAALYAYECQNCKVRNCKDCCLTKDLIFCVNAPYEDSEEYDSEDLYNCEELYQNTAEKHLVTMKSRKKGKKVASSILTEAEEEALCQVFQKVLDEREKMGTKNKDKEDEQDLDKEVEESIQQIQCEPQTKNPKTASNTRKKKSRKTRNKVSHDSSKPKPISKHEAAELDNKRKHEIEDIRTQLLKKARLASEPKIQQPHIVVRKEIIEKDMKEEIERQRRENQIHMREMEKLKRKQATQEMYRDRKTKRNMKKKNVNTSTSSSSSSSSSYYSSSIYPSSTTETSFNSSLDIASADSSIDMSRDETSIVQYYVNTLDVVTENPLFEDRKRSVTYQGQELQGEESKKMKMSDEDKVADVDPKFDRKAVLAQLHNKEQQKNMSEDAAGKKNKKNKASKARKKKSAKSSSGLHPQQKDSQDSFSSSTSMSLETSRSSYIHEEEVAMETDLSSSGNTEKKLSSRFNMLMYSFNNSPHSMGMDCYQSSQSVRWYDSFSHISTKPTYADITATSQDRQKRTPGGIQNRNKMSGQPHPFGLGSSPSLHQRRVSHQAEPGPHPGFTPPPIDSYSRKNTPIWRLSEHSCTSGQPAPNWLPYICAPLTLSNLALMYSQGNPLPPPTRPRAVNDPGGTHLDSSQTMSDHGADAPSKTGIKMDISDSVTLGRKERNPLDDHSYPVLDDHFDPVLDDHSDAVSSLLQRKSNNNGVDELETKFLETLHLTTSQGLPPGQDKDDVDDNSYSYILNQWQVPDCWENRLSQNIEDESTEDNPAVQRTKQPKEDPRKTVQGPSLSKAKAEYAKCESHSIPSPWKNLQSIWDIDQNVAKKPESIPESEKYAGLNHPLHLAKGSFINNSISENCNLQKADGHKDQSDKQLVQELLLTAFEKLELTEKSTANVEDDLTENGNLGHQPRTESRPRWNEKTKKWTWLTPQDKRKRDHVMDLNKETQERIDTIISEAQQGSDENKMPDRMTKENDNPRVVGTIDSAKPGLAPTSLPSISRNTVGLGHRGMRESSDNEMITKKELKEILTNPFVFTTQGKKSPGALGDFSRNSSAESKARVSPSVQEKWTDNSVSCFDISLVRSNFMSATQGHSNVSGTQMSKFSENQSSVMTVHKRIHGAPLMPIAVNENQPCSIKIQERKILHPIRVPRTTTKCMQVSAPTGEQWSELFSLENDKSNVAAKSDGPQQVRSSVSAHPFPGDVYASAQERTNSVVKNTRNMDRDRARRNMDQDRARLGKRITNPSALLQNALTRIKEERNTRIKEERNTRIKEERNLVPSSTKSATRPTLDKDMPSAASNPKRSVMRSAMGRNSYSPASSTAPPLTPTRSAIRSAMAKSSPGSPSSTSLSPSNPSTSSNTPRPAPDRTAPGSPLSMILFPPKPSLSIVKKLPKLPTFENN